MNLNPNWTVDTSEPDFISAVDPAEHREGLVNDREALILKGYGIQNGLNLLLEVADDDYTEQTKVARSNLQVIANTIAALDRIIERLDNPQQ